MNVPTINPGADVGHPGAVQSISALLHIINPAADISTPDKLEELVRVFQAFAGLAVDGIVGPQTATAIAERAWNHK